MNSFRYDRSAIILPPKPELTRDGFLRAYMRIARTGNLEYRNRDGSKRIERVKPDVLFDEQSMDSFATKPIALQWHPEERVTPDNIQEYGKGLTGDLPVKDGDFLGFGVTITHRDAIDAVLSRQMREASCGYGVRLSDRADSNGVFDQLFRDGNHVLICKRGRAGSQVGLHLDSESEDEIYYQVDSLNDRYWEPSEVATDFIKDIHPKWIWTLDSPQEKSKKQASTSTREKKKRMTTVKLDEVTIHLDSSVSTVDAERHINLINGELKKLRSQSEKNAERADSDKETIAELRQKLKDSEASAVTLKSNLDSANSSVEALTSENETLKSDRADSGDSKAMSNEQIAEVIVDRMKLWNEALPFLRSDSPDYDPNYELEPIAIMAEVVKVAHPELADHLDSLDTSEAKTEGFVKGLYASLNAKQFTARKSGKQNVDSLMDEIRKSRQDSIESNPETRLDSQRKKRADRIAANGLGGRK